MKIIKYFYLCKIIALVFLTPFISKGSPLNHVCKTNSKFHKALYASSYIQKTWKKQQLIVNSPPHPVLKKTLKDRQILIIPGLLNELTRWTRNQTYLIKKDLITTDLSTPVNITGFSSCCYFEDNLPAFKQTVEDLYSENQKKPIILLGHSKGGLESLYLLLTYPELILNGIIDRIILFQTPVRGCSLIGLNEQACGMKIAKAFFPDALNNLNPDTCNKKLEKLINQFQDQTSEHYFKTVLSKKVFYIQSFEESEKVNTLLKNFLKVINDYKHTDILNDGILTIDEQVSKNIGVNLGCIQADHLFLFDLSNPEKINKIKALIRSILLLTSDYLLEDLSLIY
jgi:hypothetical protein